MHGVDLGDAWMDKLHANLEHRGIDRSQLLLKPGNVRDIPHPDETFDFVTINGVLIHLNNMNEIREAFREGARVLKPGGYYYTVYGIAGGAFMDAIFPALRQYYNENDYFKVSPPKASHSSSPRGCRISARLKRPCGRLRRPVTSGWR